jgi:hypothetical protein
LRFSFKEYHKRAISTQRANQSAKKRNETNLRKKSSKMLKFASKESKPAQLKRLASKVFFPQICMVTWVVINQP